MSHLPSQIDNSPPLKRKATSCLASETFKKGNPIRHIVKANADLGENAAVLPYKIVDELLSFDNDKKGLRLCIPPPTETKVFQLAHDEMGHPGYARTHERLTQGLHMSPFATSSSITLDHYRMMEKF